MSEYLKKTTILLVSSQTSFRSGLRKLLCDLGASNRNIEIASDFDQAAERLKQTNLVNVIVTDDDIGDAHTGLELIPLLRANNPISHTRLFIMLSGETTPFLQSDFLVKGGDLLLKKPYTNGGFSEAINSLIAQKESKTPDERTADSVTDALSIKDVPLALKSYDGFGDKNSYAALLSRGKIYEMNRDFGRAFNFFAEAMEKKVELPTLVSAIAAGALSKSYPDMLPFVDMWIKKYPIHQESVPDITRTIVFNRQFNLLREMSKSLTDVKLGLIASIPMAAGYVVAAMDCQKNNPERAVFYALRGIEYSNGKPAILINAISILMNTGAKAEAEKIFAELFSAPPFSEDKNLEKEIRAIVFPESK